ncbi:MAG: DUF983 domain-containing protein [Sphingopyxis sp.]
MTTSPIKGEEGQPHLVRAALFGLCPECGAPTLFKGPISFADECRDCRLNFTAFNVGDGPAALLVMAVGALVVPAALALHFKLGPPVWVHIMLWPLVVMAMTVGGLRLAKGALICSEHQRQSHEGRIVPSGLEQSAGTGAAKTATGTGADSKASASHSAIGHSATATPAAEPESTASVANGAPAPTGDGAMTDRAQDNDGHD